MGDHLAVSIAKIHWRNLSFASKSTRRRKKIIKEMQRTTIMAFFFFLTSQAMAAVLSRSRRQTTKCYEASIAMDGSDKSWVWLKQLNSVKVKYFSSSSSNDFGSDWIVFVSTVRQKGTHLTQDVVEFAYVINEGNRCRFLEYNEQHRSSKQAALRLTDPVPCRGLHNGMRTVFKTSLQILTGKQQIAFGTTGWGSSDEKYVGYDRKRQQLTVTSLRKKEMAFWKINTKRQVKCPLSQR